ncbi:glycosyltransferase family 2 protein [Deefgea tanakiae]|uniref:Glycosyltransferase family 2 protein n=1 Tax=Deefgea tanakiae TaxID=2865840 RepID=A0ABX8Z8P0_9NEIS|nr:glycosyltransferase family A protein [Deefgea tanakiae]QZA78952.1 glycosyltransferase family 2 protein [Deefgea tanakiae]
MSSLLRSNSSLISVVVIGRNEGERLVRCFESIAACAWPNLELIYVDSGSTDQSMVAAQGAGALVLQSFERGAAAARNVGWQASKANWVLFLDGDTVLEPDYLGKAFAAMQSDPDVVCVWGHRRELNPLQSIYVRVLDLDWCYRPGQTSFCGGDALFYRPALVAVGGFDAGMLAGEEPELCHRLRQNGGTILHIDQAMTRHDLAITHFAQYWQRAVRAGYAYLAVSQQSQSFWQVEVRHNLRQTLIIVVLITLSLLLATLQSTLFFLPPMVLLGLMMRSAWRARWRSRNVLSLFLYGVHSWFEQLPVSWGILRCWCDLRQQKTAPLIEYKTSQGD